MYGLESLVGLTINKVLMSPDGSHIVFQTDSGDKAFYSDGDCCSHSWIEHVNGLKNLLGSKVLSVGESYIGEEEKDYSDYIKTYSYKLNTSNGIFEIDFRNSSNGYYGGSLESTKDVPEDLKEVLEDK